MASPININEFAEGILQKNITILSRAITLAESSREEHQEIANQVIEKILPHTGQSVRVGITGVPGVGKSTFIEAFGQLLLQNGHKVAVLAIDPSSTLSKGSILGDKTRMEKLSAQKDVFIRPSPSGGSLGGVTRKTRESILLCEAAGFNYILVETVGVGQSETEVQKLTDFFLLLMLAGAGDELQGIKRGIMEMADGILITKNDGGNKDRAQGARAEFAKAIHLFPPTESGWVPGVGVCSAIENTGIPEAYEMIGKFVRHMQAKGFFEKKRLEQNTAWFENLVQERIRERFFANETIAQKYAAARLQVEKNAITAISAVNALFS